MSRKDELIEKYKSRPGLKGKVIAHCIACVFDPANGGTWRQQTEGCMVTDCPLYEVRPLSETASKG